MSYWWSRGGSNSWPPHCELDARQKRKYLPFQKLQPPRDLKGFPALSHSIPSGIRCVQLFLATYWPVGIGPAAVLLDAFESVRPWGYESDPGLCTKLTKRKTPIKTLGRGRKEALIRCMKRRNRYDPRQNLDKTKTGVPRKSAPLVCTQQDISKERNAKCGFE